VTGELDDLTLAALRRRARDRATKTDGTHLLRVKSARPASEATLAKAEEQLGFQLPAVLRQVYGMVGNGGFGPGYGLIGIVGGVRDDLGRDVVTDYLLRREGDPHDPGWSWPAKLLAVCHWGCGIYSCVDCARGDAPVIRFDPNVVDRDWSIAFGQEQPTFAAWVQAWLAGEEMFESGSVQPLELPRQGL
jgi:hypothetical protein